MVSFSHMRITKKQWLTVGISFFIIVVLVTGAVQLSSSHTPISPSPAAYQPSIENDSATENSNTTAPEPKIAVTPVGMSNSPGRPARTTLTISEKDSIISWDFKSAYMDNPELAAKARDEISRLSGLLATATSSTMILSVSIANQYELLGDGKKQYEYLGRAVQAAPTNGLPWHNLGVLMERLGAFQTARMAFEQSTIVQPQLSVYHYAYLEFLITHMKNDTVTIEKAFAAAEKNVGKRQDFLDLRAQWQTS